MSNRHSFWMKDRHLQLNLAKTELLVVSTNPSLHHNFAFQLGSSTVTPSKTARNLGVVIDDKLNFTDRIAKTYFLTGRSQVVRMGNNISSPLVLNTGAPQGCVLCPLLYSLYTHDCTATHSSNIIVKFADDTMVIGLITDNDEMAYKEEVSTLTKW